MRNDWRVTSNIVGGQKMYAVYRLRDPKGIDNSGNRELHSGYMLYQEAAAALARHLNNQEKDQ